MTQRRSKILGGRTKYPKNPQPLDMWAVLANGEIYQVRETRAAAEALVHIYRKEQSPMGREYMPSEYRTVWWTARVRVRAAPVGSPLRKIKKARKSGGAQ